MKQKTEWRSVAVGVDRWLESDGDCAYSWDANLRWVNFFNREVADWSEQIDDRGAILGD